MNYIRNKSKRCYNFESLGLGNQIRLNINNL